jgi:hypothetical protein
MISDYQPPHLRGMRPLCRVLLHRPLLLAGLRIRCRRRTFLTFHKKKTSPVTGRRSNSGDV